MILPKIYLLINYIYSIFCMSYIFDVENIFIVCFFSLFLSFLLVHISSFYRVFFEKFFVALITLIFSRNYNVIFNSRYIANALLGYSFYYLLGFVLMKESYIEDDFGYLLAIFPVISAMLIFKIEKLMTEEKIINKYAEELAKKDSEYMKEYYGNLDKEYYDRENERDETTTTLEETLKRIRTEHLEKIEKKKEKKF